MNAAFAKKNLDHINIVHNRIKDFECSNCSKKFGLKYHLQRHIKNVHKNIHDFKFNICAKQFTRKPNFQQDLKTMQRIKNFKCNICDKKVETYYKLWKHIK